MPRHAGLIRKMHRMALIVAVAVAGGRLPLEAQNSIITGALKDTAGGAVAGALVKVSNQEPGPGFMVVSQAQGRYSTPNLLPGKYTIQAFGDKVQSAPAGPVEVRRGEQTRMDLDLNVPLQIPPRTKRLTDDDYEKLMPESEDVGIKQIIATDCKECHSLQWTVSARKNREQWRDAVLRMYNDLIGFPPRMPLWFALKDYEFTASRRQDTMLDYLAKHFGPDTPVDPRAIEPWVVRPGGPPHPNRNLPGSLLQGPASKYVVMEFALPAGATPHDIAADSQGIAWVSESNTGMIGRFDPGSLSYTRIAVPPGKNPQLQLNAIAVDAKDRVWLADDGPNGRLLQYDPKTREFNSYPIPEYRWPVPDSGWARIATLRFSNGTVWGTRLTAQRIVRLDTTTGKITETSVPRGSMPFGLAIGGDSMIWYAAQVGNVVVRLNPATGRLTPFTVPTDRSDLHGMAADGEGNLWVAATESGKLIKVDYRTGNLTEYSPPTENSGPYSLDADTNRNLVWFSQIFTDRIGRFDVASKTFVEYPLASADVDVRRIEVDRSRPNRVWWSGAQSDRIGYLEVIEDDKPQ